MVTTQALRSETRKRPCRCATALRRRSGLRSFPGTPPSTCRCPAPARPRSASSGRSPSPPGWGAVRVGNFLVLQQRVHHGRGCHAARTRRMFGRPFFPGGVSDEHRGTPTSEAPAAVVRAHGLARSSSPLPTQWRSLPVDHVEQARLGCASSHDHRTEVRARAQRHHRLPRRWPKPHLDRDERLGRGSSLVVAQPRGTPRRRRSTDRPASAPGACAPGRGAGA